MKDIKQKRGKLLSWMCCTLCLSMVMILPPMRAAATENSGNTSGNSLWPKAPVIASEAGIVMEASTGTVLYEKNIHDTHYPASITKIMTALLTIENCEMDEIVTIPSEAVYMENKGTHIALDVGEELTVEQCLYAIMLASANDAAYALAVHVGGKYGGTLPTSEPSSSQMDSGSAYEQFIRMMNDRAKELGCQDTNFTNPHGLPDENHVTSAYDMALITKAALQYDIFRTVSGTTYYEIPPSEHQKDLIQMYNHHKMIGVTELQNPEVFAGKNGYTDVARYTLTTCASRDDMTIICVVLQASGDQIYQDTGELLNYGLDSFSKVAISSNTDSFEEMLKKEDSLFENCKVSGISLDNPYLILPKESSAADLRIDFEYENTPEKVTAQYFYGNRLIGQATLTVEGLQPEDNDIEAVAQPSLSEEENNKESLFKWRYVLFAILILLALAAAALKISVEWRRYKKKLRRKMLREQNISTYTYGKHHKNR